MAQVILAVDGPVAIVRPPFGGGRLRRNRRALARCLGGVRASLRMVLESVTQTSRAGALPANLDEFRAHLELEMHDPLDLRLAGRTVRLE